MKKNECRPTRRNAHPALHLRAGHLRMLFEPDTAFLRRICSGEHEVVRCIYAAVRDRNWGTVPAVIGPVEASIQEDHFELRFQADWRQMDIHFVWTGTLRGSREGVVTFEFDGQARTTFLKNRIGLCVLHPQSCAGLKAWSETTAGTRVERRFPELIEPQVFGKPPFGDVRKFAHEYLPGKWATLDFSGDVFEMEDQRNWTDASFKTYCTPLAQPFPAEIQAGARIQQTVVLTADAPPAKRAWTPHVEAGETAAVFEIQLPGSPEMQLPDIGLCAPGSLESLTAEEKLRLEQLRLSHFRVDLDLKDPLWHQRLAAAHQHLDAPLELTAHLPGDSDGRVLKTLREALPANIRRITVLRHGEPATTPETFQQARGHLGGAGIPLGIGTNTHFCELNREHALGRCRPAEGDFITWPITPQVHTFDNLSVMENLEAQAATVITTKAFSGGKPLCLSPITLKPRFNAVAASREQQASDSLPPHVDPRQSSVFTAAWTLGSLIELARAGAASATYFETVGWGGLMNTGTRQDGETARQAAPGVLYPVYHLFAALAGYTKAALLSLPVGKSAGLCLFSGNSPVRLIVGDLTGDGFIFKLPVPAHTAQHIDDQQPSDLCECRPDAQGRWHLGSYGLLLIALDR